MTIQLSAPKTTELKPRIVVFGVGGAGCNAVNNMIDAGLEGVEFVVANTDAQSLGLSKTQMRIQLGAQTTQGLGAGAHPDVGMTAAEESIPEIGEHLDGAHMVFITAGMGGGTGTGAAPIIAKCARERGILTVGVVTKPFTFEGRHRLRLADAGITELQRYVDTLIIIPNQNLFRLANESTTFAEAFGIADQVLHSGVRSITDLMVLPGLINLDFADVRTVMTEMGKAMMGTGEADGEARALMAAQNAIQNPLLDEISLKGAKAVLVNVTGGLDMTLLEVDEAANAISEQVDPEANIIFGAAFDPSLDGMIRVSVVATGMDGASIAAIEPASSLHVSRTRAPLAAAPTEPVREETPVAEAPAPEPVAASEIHEEPEPDLSRPQFQPSGPVHAVQAQIAEEFSRPEPAQAQTQEEDEAPLPFDEPLTGEALNRALGMNADIEAQEPLVEAREEFEEEPLFTDRHRSQVDDKDKKGFFSLFGRPRQDDPAPIRDYRNDPSAVLEARAAKTGGAAVAPKAEDLPEPSEDLEIPSFLRRLAN